MCAMDYVRIVYVHWQDFISPGQVRQQRYETPTVLARDSAQSTTTYTMTYHSISHLGNIYELLSVLYRSHIEYDNLCKGT